MQAQVSDVDRLVFGFNTLNFLDFAWLHERMAEANPKYEKEHANRFRGVFPDLPFTPEWLAQAWSLYTPYAPHHAPKIGREVTFLYFILGLQEAWPKGTTFSEAVLRIVMKKGATRARQILNIVSIFHESNGILPLPTSQKSRSTPM
ncbi:hypothetical protein [Cupriavidus pinatubonensis]|uniref:Uncharacterized protein n=1 Tax=Cupriavidus pinatubonensis TaxID=248026 RepID=A0ABN7Y8X5_9BURK|nr:hypothetical protein [Cupriavidus pinatubonensis]CAG9169849.1 hypothetical protein LMG23994_01694 [Cupriavidus pinatubonensis]